MFVSIPRTPVPRESPTAPEPDANERLTHVLAVWAQNPVQFVLQAIGATPDPWACDVLDAISAEDSVALRSSHGIGKSALLSWATIWFTVTRAFPKVPTTAPTFNKQVKDILWAEVHRWWRSLTNMTPWLANTFRLTTTRLAHVEHSNEWFAVGIASSQPINVEGYHSPHLLAVFDEAKGIGKGTWEAVHGMRTTQEAKLLVASTPGGPSGEFYKVFTQYRQTWRRTFIVHPEALRATLKRPESPPFSTSGRYYSSRVRPEWVEERRIEWGADNPVFIARVIGDFPTVEGDVLIPFSWISEAQDREQGVGGPVIVSCDVARYGRDRTVILVGEGGTLLHGETIARSLDETTAPEGATVGVGADARHPRYRATDITADALQRVRREYNAAAIVVDDVGLGGGVTDQLKRRGERVVPLNFGASPTDKPVDAEQARSRQRRHLLDSVYSNLKSQMGFVLRSAFEIGAIALARLPQSVVDPLIAQTSMVKREMDARGRMRIVDPDEQDPYEMATGSMEGRKSPDHFHALLLYWWIAGGPARAKLPRAQAILDRAPRVGEMGGFVPAGGGVVAGGQAAGIRAGVVGGQAAMLRRYYR